MTTIVSASQDHHQVDIKLLQVKDTNIGGAGHTGSGWFTVITCLAGLG
jgi:hypothetical protein